MNSVNLIDRSNNHMASLADAAHRFTAVAGFPKDIECSICLDSWSDPVELQPCGHIYCRKCVARCQSCPECRAKIASTTTPNRILINLANQVTVSCNECPWTGNREESERAHPKSSCPRTGNTPALAAPPATRPPMSCSSADNPQYPSNNFNHGSGVYNPPSAPPQQQQQWYPPHQQASPSYPPTRPPPQQPYAYQQAQPVFYGGGSGSYNYPPNYPTNSAPPPPAPYPYPNNGWQQRPTAPPPNAGGYQVIDATRGPHPWAAYDLGQLEYDQIMGIFMMFDTDDSGELSRPQLKRLCRCLNYARSDADIERIFTQMDADGSGSLSLAEFCTWLKFNKPNPEALYGLSQYEYNTILMHFFERDSNHDGTLDVNEFKSLGRELGMTPDVAEMVFREIDINHDGAVDLHEYLLYRKSYHRR